MTDHRNTSRRGFLQSLGLLGLAGLGPMVSACGGSSGKETGSSTAASEKSGRSAQSGTSASEGPVAKTVTLHPKGNQMKYKETKLTVPAGKNVKLVFENTATSPSMQHNVVVLTKSPKQKFFKKVGQAGVSAGSTSDYVPSDMASVLTHTPIAKPGETVSVTFQAPSEPGKYGYVCTYPGHWATMQGAMVVKG